MDTATTTLPAFELWKARVAELEARFAREAEQLTSDLTACDAELERATNIDRAVELLARRDRAQRRLAALQAVRRNALGAAREAAVEAARRDDSLCRARARLEHAVAVAEGTPNTDERTTAERDVAFLRQRVAELEQQERADIERLATETPTAA